jgi:hypothetical protein
MSRIGKERGDFVMLKKVWASKQITMKTTIRFFNSSVKSVLLYGCETRRKTETVLLEIKKFFNTCPRRIYNIRWPDKILDEDLRKQAGQEPEQIPRRKWG